jgi:hypothetical protein
MPAKGFTLSILPHGGKPPRLYEFSGRRLVILRIVLGALSLVVCAAVVLVVLGIAGPLRGAGFRDRVEVLEDSLTLLRGYESRLDSIETVLEQVELMRARLESLSEIAGPAPGDSL